MKVRKLENTLLKAIDRKKVDGYYVRVDTITNIYDPDGNAAEIKGAYGRMDGSAVVFQNDFTIFVDGKYMRNKEFLKGVFYQVVIDIEMMG